MSYKFKDPIGHHHFKIVTHKSITTIELLPFGYTKGK